MEREQAQKKIKKQENLIYVVGGFPNDNMLTGKINHLQVTS